MCGLNIYFDLDLDLCDLEMHFYGGHTSESQSTAQILVLVGNDTVNI